MKITYVPESIWPILEEFEGFKANPYTCPAGKATIGYGSTLYPDGRAVTLKDKPVDKATARKMAESHLLKHSAPVLERLINVPLNQNQVAALLDFTYNSGGGYMDKGVWTPFKLWALVNANTPESELKAYWAACAIKGGGVVLPGLVRRRKAEADLFFS